jgi:hypothetical protein
MDYRLDLFNAIDNYLKHMTKQDAIFIVAHNAKDGDLMLGIDGDIDFLSGVLSGNSVKIESKEEAARFEQTKSMVLNIAINILNSDNTLKDKFQIALNNLNHVEK